MSNAPSRGKRKIANQLFYVVFKFMLVLGPNMLYAWYSLLLFLNIYSSSNINLFPRYPLFRFFLLLFFYFLKLSSYPNKMNNYILLLFSLIVISSFPIFLSEDFALFIYLFIFITFLLSKALQKTRNVKYYKFCVPSVH